MSEERLKKLIALRDGTNKPGERAAAQAAIDRLLDKGHQLPEEKKVRWVRFNRVQDRRLFTQVFASVIGDAPKEYWENPIRKKQRGFDLTDAEWAEIELLYAHYKAALKKHMEASFRAFVIANKLFGRSKGKYEELDSEEQEEIDRATAMANGAYYGRPAKQIKAPR
ncbi:MAG: hypothetical protein KDE47_11185 [Caldilineaceae bacterium]|nr:hypothetical protein [Planctomycetaceae bacterium]MCB0081491.1 hypothetical protein [Caldilineaceae bacterium]